MNNERGFPPPVFVNYTNINISTLIIATISFIILFSLFNVKCMQQKWLSFLLYTITYTNENFEIWTRGLDKKRLTGV